MASLSLFASGQPRISMQWRPQELNMIDLKRKRFNASMILDDRHQQTSPV